MGGGGSTYRSADGIWHAAIAIEPDRATGRRRRLTAQGKTKAVANARLRMKLDAYVRKGFTPNSPSPRLMDWLETWYHERAEANLRPNSRRSYENAIVRLNKIAGARRINSLGHKDMAAIQDGLKCYSPKTATLTWSVLKNALEAARDENLIQRNPAKMVRTVSGRRKPMKVLSPEQAAELIKAEPDPMWRLNWLLAFATGLRQGERLGLTMDELTTLNGRRALVIDHQLQRVPDSGRADWPLGEDVTDLGNGFWLCPPKTDSGERIVVLDDVMCGALGEWLAIRKQKGVDLPRAVRHLVMQTLPLHVDLEQVAFLGEPEVREHQPVRQTPVGRDDRVRGFASHRQRRPVEVPRRPLQRGGVRAVAHRQADVQPRIADRPHCALAVRVEQPTVLLVSPAV
jgi:integrase